MTADNPDHELGALGAKLDALLMALTEHARREEQTLVRLEGLVERLGGRVQALELWRAGIVAVLSVVTVVVGWVVTVWRRTP